MTQRTKAQVRGLLYNSRAIIEGLIKMVETDVLTPEQAEEALIKSIGNELSREFKNPVNQHQ